MLRTNTGRKARAAAAAVAGTVALTAALAPAGAAAQDTTRADTAAARRAVRAIVDRSQAFRDSVDGVLERDVFDYDAPSRRSRFADRFTGGVALSVSQPTGTFRRIARVGVGLAAGANLSADRAGVLSLRADGGWQNYGRSSTLLTDDRGFFAVGPARQITTNDVFWASIGPQVTLPLGPVRPYGFASIGFANFSTNTRFDAQDVDRQRVASVQNFSDWGVMRGYGGGLRVQVARERRAPVFLDLGARAHRIGSVRFLAPGLVPFDLDGASLARQGRADFVTYHVGVSVGAR